MASKDDLPVGLSDEHGQRHVATGRGRRGRAMAAGAAATRTGAIRRIAGVVVRPPMPLFAESQGRLPIVAPPGMQGRRVVQPPVLRPDEQPPRRVNLSNAPARPILPTPVEDPLDAAPTLAIDASVLASLRNRSSSRVPAAPSHDAAASVAEPERTVAWSAATLREAREGPSHPSMPAAAPRGEVPPSTLAIDVRSLRRDPPRTPVPVATTMLSREQMLGVSQSVPVGACPPMPPVRAMVQPPAVAVAVAPFVAAPSPMALHPPVAHGVPAVTRRPVGLLVVALLLVCVALGAGGGAWLAR